MIPLPPGFEWLDKLTAPLMAVEARKLYGVFETPGADDNATILSWAKETELDHMGYIHDEIPWCGLFMAVVAKRANKLPPTEPLRALAWATFGVPSPLPSLGDVLVYRRYNELGKLVGGHVTLYVAESTTHYYGLGGNQGDAVSIASKLKSALYMCRRPIYRMKPNEVRPYSYTPTVASVLPVATKEV